MFATQDGQTAGQLDKTDDIDPDATHMDLKRNQLALTLVSVNPNLGPYAPQGSTSLLPKLSVTSKVSARTSCAWVGSRVHFRSSEDVILLQFTSPIDREYMRRRQKFH